MLGMLVVYGRPGMACLESYGMFGMYGRYGMYGMNGLVLFWMVGMVCKPVGYGMFDMTVCMVCMGMYGYADG